MAQQSLWVLRKGIVWQYVTSTSAVSATPSLLTARDLASLLHARSLRVYVLVKAREGRSCLASWSCGQAGRTPGYPEHCLQAALDIVFRRRPGRHTDTHRRPAVPLRPTAPTGPFGLNAINHSTRRRVVAEANQHLIERDLVQHLVPGGREPGGEPGGVTAAALHQVGEPGTAERRERRPDLDPARPARQLRCVVVRLARRTPHQVRRLGGHGAPQRGCAAAP